MYIAKLQLFREYCWLKTKKNINLQREKTSQCVPLCSFFFSYSFSTFFKHQYNKMKLNYLYLAILDFLLVGCSDSDDENQSSRQPQKSIVILYENDVHCNIEGYTKLAGLRDAIAASDTAYVGVVSNGD